jgi:hypothetical protein
MKKDILGVKRLKSNNDAKKLTIEEIKMIPRFKNISDEEAELIKETIYKFSELTYYIINETK